MADSRLLLEIAVRKGILAPDEADRHSDARTPNELVTRGVIEPAEGELLDLLLRRLEEDRAKGETLVRDGRLKEEELRSLRAHQVESIHLRYLTLHEAAKELSVNLEAALREDQAKGPARVGRYAVEKELGQGGMGVVYRAEDTELRRTVAVKMMRAGVSDEEKSRFLREARASAALRHPGIVPVYDVGEEEGRPFFVMELVEGSSLQEALESGELGRREALRILRDAAEGVAYAHENGVLHRDLKPANIMVTKDRRGVVMDFGLAKLREREEEKGLTVDGVAFGTPAYMSPEQARGEWDNVDERSEVYSLGATLYHILTGGPPFRAKTVVETLRSVLTYDPIPPRRLDPTVEPDLETICFKALEKEPGRRYAGAREFAEDLRRFLEGEPILARKPSLWRRLKRTVLKRRALLAIATVFGLVATASVLLLWPGKAEISSDPAGAEIWMNGRNTGKRTPAVLSLWPPGRYVLELRRADYEIARVEMEGRLWKRGAAQVRLVPDHGFLAIRMGSIRAEAWIFQGGARRRLGIAPLAPLRLPTGTYRLELVAPRFREWSGEVTISPGKTLRFRPVLDPVRGIVRLEGVHAGAEYRLYPLEPGRPEIRGTVGEGELSPPVGRYRLEVSLQDHLPLRFSVNVEEGRTLRIAGTLKSWRVWERKQPVTLCEVTADLDKDGTPDVLVLRRLGADAFSGRTGRRIWRGLLRAVPEEGDRLKVYSRGESDLDGDGVPDLIVGETEGRTGRVYVLSGKDGGSLLRITGHPRPLPDLRAGDLDGDGTPDLVWYTLGGKVAALSGRTRKILWEDGRIEPAIGYRCGEIDADGDGRGDLLLEYAGPRLDVRSGKNGKPLWSAPGVRFVAMIGRDLLAVDKDRRPALLSAADGKVRWRGEGRLLGGAADVDGDGTPDFLLRRPERTILISGKDRKAILESPEIREGDRMEAAGDADGDGIRDLFMGGARGAVISGKTGRALWALPPGGRVASAGDVTGDRIPDFIRTEGKEISLYSGRDGSRLWTFPLPSAVSFAGTADFDSDGRPELLVATPQGIILARSVP